MKSSAIRKQNTQTVPKLWQPTDAPHLRVWVKHDLLPQTGGAAVSSLPDGRNGSPNVYAQGSSAQQPTIVLPLSKGAQYFGAETVYMDFDGSNDLVADQSPDFDNDDLAPGDIIFCVPLRLDRSATSVNATVFSLQRNATNEEIRLFYSSVSTGNKISFRAQNPLLTTTLQGADDLDDTTVLVSGHIIGESGGNNMKLFQNGTEIAQGDFAYTFTGDHDFVIGALNVLAGQPYEGFMPEMCIYTNSVRGSMVENTRERVEGYMAHKFGLTSSLPATHPYKYGPPRV
jgi:hypothetical protein